MKILQNLLMQQMALPIIAFIFLAGCSDSSHNDVESLKISSYNMGLALNFVPYTQERVAANVTLLAEHDSDVICFQEVWLEEHVDAVSSAVADDFPFLYAAAPEQVFSEDAACSSEEIADFADCANTQCEGQSGTSLVSCATSLCGGFIAGLSSSCVDGVVGGVGIPGITVAALVDLVTQPAGKFAFDGALGLIIASKYPLSNTEFQDFLEDSSGNHRGALYAEITLNDETHVVGCTHPTANLSATIGYPASGKHGSWEGENYFQQQQMVTFVNNKAGENAIYFAGDFNCSLKNESHGVGEDFIASCQLWLDNGFIDPAADQLSCSFCSDENLILNPQQLSGGGGGEGNLLLDHLFVKNASKPAVITAERIFDQALEIEALDPEQELLQENSPLITHPSDHFGVQISVPL